jgi:hypothetical protein
MTVTRFSDRFTRAETMPSSPFRPRSMAEMQAPQ